MTPQEHVEAVSDAMAPHWPADKPWPTHGVVADRLLLADCACVEERLDERRRLLLLARSGEDVAVRVEAARIRTA